MKSRLSSSLLLAAGMTFALIPCAPAGETTHTLAFSDASRPGTVVISLGRGDLHVEGADTTDVTVRSNTGSREGERREDGMRVLSAASSFTLSESENVITLDASAESNDRGNAAFQVNVPRGTSLIIHNSRAGDVICTDIDGDIEINSRQGQIRLENVGGGVVAGTMNGEIRASFRELSPEKPLSFTSMNGEVVIRVPESAKANVRLRTQNGSVLTDFPESVLITRAEATDASPRGRGPFVKGGQVLTTEVQEAIREATQISATAIKEALEAIKAGLDAAGLESDDARRQLEDARRQMERARRELERERQDAERKLGRSRGHRLEPDPAPMAPPTPRSPGPVARPTPPQPKMPTIMGGKLVTGTLNGGGTEINVSTMNGDVILRKLASSR